jgi:hypothetical protein
LPQCDAQRACLWASFLGIHFGFQRAELQIQQDPERIHTRGLTWASFLGTTWVLRLRNVTLLPSRRVESQRTRCIKSGPCGSGGPVGVHEPAAVVIARKGCAHDPARSTRSMRSTKLNVPAAQRDRENVDLSFGGPPPSTISQAKTPGHAP